MTIALGVMCTDGIVLGVDLEYAQDVTAMPGRKLFWICPGRPYSILIAASGNPDSAKQVVELAQEFILSEFPDIVPNVKQVKNCITNALKRVYFDHIDRAPAGERADLRCDLLIAIRIGREARLYYTNRTMLIEEMDTKCFGVGLFFSNYAVSSLLPLSPSVEVASQVVTQIIALAKHHVRDVGQGSDVHMLYTNGRHDSLHVPERKDIESGFMDLMNHFQEVIACIDADRVPDDGIALRMEWLTSDVYRLRDLQRQRQRRPGRSSPAGAPLNPGSTISGSSPQQPLQESPEGSDES